MSVGEGDMAPEFEMPATGGRTVSLAGLKGKPFVLYFYPKADTPGCTKEACAFQEALPQLGSIGLDVIGVSPDKMKPIEKFAEKFSLSFPLASDETKEVAERYAQGRIVSCLEGGYALSALGRSVEAHLRVLADV